MAIRGSEMKHILTTPEGGRAVVDLQEDIVLYSAPRNPPNTGLAYTRGTDLYMHSSRAGRKYFYVHRWSMWQGEQPSFELISEDAAKNFILQRATNHGYVADGIRVDNCKEVFGEDLFTHLLFEKMRKA